MPSVTYLGPVDPHVPTTRYRLPAEDADETDAVLPKGIEIDVNAAQAKRLREDDEHMFSIDGKKTSSAKKSG